MSTGPHKLPPPHTAEWRLHVAQQIVRAGWQSALNYLECAGDPNPKHTAAQAIWREAIETTAEAVPIANDNREFAPLLGDEGD
jgi:hypothetical protein